MDLTAYKQQIAQRIREAAVVHDQIAGHTSRATRERNYERGYVSPSLLLELQGHSRRTADLRTVVSRMVAPREFVDTHSHFAGILDLLATRAQAIVDGCKEATPLETTMPSSTREEGHSKVSTPNGLYSLTHLERKASASKLGVLEPSSPESKLFLENRKPPVNTLSTGF